MVSHEDTEFQVAFIDEETTKRRPVVFIEQYVKDFHDFSSQYGSNISISYTANNLVGPPNKFPDYGDFSQSFVMVIYIFQ